MARQIVHRLDHAFAGAAREAFWEEIDAYQKEKRMPFPDAKIWLARVGQPAAYQIGATLAAGGAS